jgi:hypothetical protein
VRWWVLVLAVTVLSGAGLPAGIQEAMASSARPSPIPTVAETAAPDPSVSLAPEPRSAARLASDWEHVRQVVSWLRYHTPPRRVVYLLGGSGSRESVGSEDGWAAQLQALVGGRAETYVLSSSCQTFAEDLRIVQNLPRNRGVALISLGVTRFQMVHKSAGVPREAVRREPPGRWSQHRYDWRASLSRSEKRRLVRAWLSEHYAGLVERCPGRLAELHDVVDACLDRGVRPVLLEMPLDPVVGDDLDEATALYEEGCRALAKEHGVRYLRFASAISWRADDYYDLYHLLPAGRARWQSRLSHELAGKGIL